MGQTSSFLSGELPDFATEITIIVHDFNSEPIKFVAPQTLFAWGSKFSSAKAATRDIHLHGVEPGTLARYLMWVYRKKVALDSDCDIGNEACAERICRDLVNLGLLADLLKDEKCQNAAMDSIVAFLKKLTGLKGMLLFSPRLTITIWSATTEGSPLRRVALDYTLACADRDYIEAHRDGFHPGFIQDILSMNTSEPQLVHLQNSSSNEAAKPAHCFYHAHDGSLGSRFCLSFGLHPAEDEHLSTGIVDLSKTMTLIINQEEPENTATFTVPESLLTENSEFFKAACRNNWREALSRTIKIPEVSIAAFNTYLYWVYRKKVATNLFPKASNCGPMFNGLVDLWLLADRFLDTRLRDSIMDMLRRSAFDFKKEIDDWTTVFTPEMTMRIWSATTRGRSLRRFVVDIYESKVTAEIFDRARDDCHPEFLSQFAMRMMLMRGGDANVVWEAYTSDSKCHYHEHDENEGHCYTDD